MKRARFLGILSPFLILAAAVCFGGGGGEAAPVNPKGSIDYIEGDVRLNEREVELGQIVEVGSTILTGPGSYCEVVFRGKNIFQIQENSLVTISIDENQGRIDLQRGALAAVFSRLQNLGTVGSSFDLHTPTAVAGVRGTAFFIKVEDAENTYICTCNGRTSLGDVAGGNDINVSSTHHSAYRFSRKGGPISRSKAGLLYHTDNTMNRLAAKILVSIDWGTGGYGY
ncbi:MAG TPA: FecR family protein [Spirochaetia bacterium]|nr:FecR family protein [Spirochaetia bacterium]